MAYRGRSWFTKVIVLLVVALAAFGAYTLYQDNQSQADEVVRKVKSVGKVLVK